VTISAAHEESTAPAAAHRGPPDAEAEAKKVAFDRVGCGDKVLLISGFPQTRLSWSGLVPLIGHKLEAVPADLPSFGDSGLLDAPATTENVARVFHAFVAKQGAAQRRRS
jgi:hypothetical protein